jgi:hypothetical protein
MADFKKDIEELIIKLNNRGIDRRAIEADLDYSEFYLDQIISKGGNGKVLKRLQKYYIEKSNMVQEPDIPLEKEDHPQNDSQREKSLHALIESNKTLVETNRDLTGMLKQSFNRANSDYLINNPEVLRPWMKIIAAGGVNKFWKDERAGLLELSRILNEYQDQMQEAHS